MRFSNRGVYVLKDPKVGILDLGGQETSEFVRADGLFLRRLFEVVNAVESSAPKCDVLFLYARIAATGDIAGSSNGLRDLIRESGAAVVVVASPNAGTSYIRAGAQRGYGRANLVMTLNRRGDSFGRFFFALFSKMKEGVSMPVAWAELSPQVPGKHDEDLPETIFACEIGQIAFG